MAVKYDLISIKTAALKALPEFSKRCMLHTAKWLAEIVFALKEVKLENVKLTISNDGIFPSEYDTYLVAHSYFMDQEYDRCTFYLKSTTSPVCKFLRYYAMYMSLEIKKIFGTTDANLFSFVPDTPSYLSNMHALCNELKIAYINNQLDGYCLYVYGLVLKKLSHFEDAKDILIEAIDKETLNWAAWQELSPLIPEKNWIDSLTLPDHWMKDFFLGHLLIDLQLNKEAEEAYKIILKNGFQNSQYVMGQIAICQHNCRDIKAGIEIYNNMRKVDPFRLEGMDTFSNLLYVDETRRALAFLAQSVTEIDKYRVETSCVVGNYYSMRGEHTKAILSFQRAVKMNPLYLSAWTLMGHEYMEVKNTSAAILSYQKAINANKRDYRAWYGLGQAYDLQRLPLFSLYYYKIAQQLRPQDSRMLIALGETYERLEKFEEVYKCYQQARTVGKNDALAIIRMAKLLERLGESDLAAETYADLIAENCDFFATLTCKPEYCHACMFLVKHHVNKDNIEKAKYYANQLKRHAEFEDAYEKAMQIIAPKKKDSSTSNNENRQFLNLEESIRQLFPW